MKKSIALTVSTLLLGGCAGGYAWQRGGDGDKAALQQDAGECRRLARHEIPSDLGPFPLRSMETEVISPGPSVERFQKRNQLFEGCMVGKGWQKVKTSGPS